MLLVVDIMKLSSAKLNLTWDFYMDFTFSKHFLLTKQTILNQLLKSVGNKTSFFLQHFSV